MSAALIHRIVKPADVVDVPVSPVSSRFPLGLPIFGAPISEQGPSPVGVRPFGLRFATTVSDRSLPTTLPWRLCPERQIAVVDDGSSEPWYRRLQAKGTGSMKSTGPSPDGGGSTGGEEWTPDYMGDASA